MKKILQILIFCTVQILAQSPEIHWTETYGDSLEEMVNAVRETTDGGYIIIGHTYSFGKGKSDIWLIKIDSNGDTLWTKSYGGAEWDWGLSVFPTADSGYILAGRCHSYGAGGYDVWLLKTDKWGDTIWTKTYGGTADDWASAMALFSDGGYILLGRTYSTSSGQSDLWLVKTDSKGDTLWTKIYGGISWDVGISVQETSDGGYIATGSTESFGHGGSDIWLLKTDALGDTLWTKTFGGIKDEVGYFVQETSNNGYIIVGYTTSFGAGSYDCWIVKTNSNGDTVWTKTYGGTEWDAASSIQQTVDGGYIVAGYTKSFGNGNFDVLLIKLGSEPTKIVLDELMLRRYKLEQNYPNPFNPTTTIGYVLQEKSNAKLTLLNALGEDIAVLVNEEQDKGYHKIEFDGSNLTSGVYFYRIKASSASGSGQIFVDTKKMILLK